MLSHHCIDNTSQTGTTKTNLGTSVRHRANWLNLQPWYPRDLTKLVWSYSTNWWDLKLHSKTNLDWWVKILISYFTLNWLKESVERQTPTKQDTTRDGREHSIIPRRGPRKFSCNDPDQDAKSFVLTVEDKINFSLGSRYCLEKAHYLFRKKALFSSLLRGSAAEGMIKTTQ